MSTGALESFGTKQGFPLSSTARRILDTEKETVFVRSQKKKRQKLLQTLCQSSKKTKWRSE